MKKLLLWLFAGAIVVGLTLGPVAPALAKGSPPPACTVSPQGFDAGEDGFDAGEDRKAVGRNCK